MKKSLIMLPALLAMAMAATVPVFAATASAKANEATCTSLEHQYDAAVASHSSAKNFKQAQMMRTDGGTACKAGNFADGAKKLHAALRDLGVKATK